MARGHQAVVPNVQLASWEADLVSITQAGYLHEWECKCSRGDFFADLKKRKHRWLGRGHLGSSYYPARLWYVAPPGLIKPKWVPQHAGLVTVNGGAYVRCAKVEVEAPQLHRHPITERQWRWLARISTYKLWNKKAQEKRTKKRRIIR
jgi:hypothetical protein